tara:strand:+ start:1544 stop:1723 length:180 start_codon:yes stop_codon:yes gene_type:complete
MEENQDKLNYDDVCRIVGDIYLKSFETLKVSRSENEALRKVLQDKIEELIEENKALKSG